MTRVNIRKMN
ncbi:Protein CBG25294 [Caenorhabditis briggsae]|uniref:Protein CBG25294 n=1 Tax=Caenorhabditis briggsae TaxID=6238 RepID=B6IIG4_CAEBR|nr:Protein CBG25294 [Caenorhabditis briggsae]CAR99694.1 Protein CBG25294 [Caenorhabditis briggsae]